MTRTVIALYDNISDANSTVRELVDNGFPREDISLMAGDTSGEYGKYITDTSRAAAETSGAAEGAGVGAGIGAALGGIGGLLIGLGALAIPGIGPVIAAGPLAAALAGLAGAGAGAVAGGVTGGLLGALVDLGVPEEAAGYYAEGVHRGGTLVTVRTADHLSDRAVDVMNRYNPIDINQRAEEWRRTGWAGIHEGREYSRHDDVRHDEVNQEGRIPVTGEVTDTNYRGPGPSDYSSPGFVGRTNPEPGSSGMSDMGYTGRQGRTDEPIGGMSGKDNDPDAPYRGTPGPADYAKTGYVGSAHPEPMPGDADYQRRHIEPNEPVGGMSGMDNDIARAEGEGMHGTGPTSRSDIESTHGTMGTTGEFDTTRGTSGSMGTTGSDYDYRTRGDMPRYNDFGAYESTFRNRFATSPYANDYTYEDYQPAYHYGYDLAVDDRYYGRDWKDVEFDAQRRWEEQHPGTWERFKDSVRDAWQEIRDAAR